MIQCRTNSCSTLGHSEISISVDRAFAGHAEFLLRNFFEREIAQGRRFKAEETVQIGWMLTMLKLNSTGDLEMWEPGFDSFPIQWIKEANNTLRHILIQRGVCEQVGVEPDFPSICDAGVVSRRFIVPGSSFSMSRDARSDRDSGWVFTITNEEVEPSDGEFRSLFEISFFRPEMITFISLPPGASVIVEKEAIEVTVEGRHYSSKDYDFLNRISQSSIII